MDYREEILSIMQQIRFKESFPMEDDFSNVVVLGMGGSGIVGHLFREIYGKKPVTVVSDYSIPDFVDHDTLTIAVSHSGNTEETLHAMDQCEARGSRIVMITSGGKMGMRSHGKVIIPGNLQPRCSLGYMLVPILRSFDLFDARMEDETAASLERVISMENDIRSMAESIVGQRKIPVIYGIPPFYSVAYRWRTQFNENAKMLCYSSNIPEMNHNELAALPKCYGLENFTFFVAGSPSGRIKERIAAVESIANLKLHTLPNFSRESIPNIFSWILYGDLVSYYAALGRSMDPREVEAITKLKKMLSG